MLNTFTLIIVQESIDDEVIADVILSSDMAKEVILVMDFFLKMVMTLKGMKYITIGWGHSANIT